MMGGNNTRKQLAAESLRFQAHFLPGFLHIPVDVRKQVAELLPFLSAGLDGVVLRQKAGQVLAQSPLDRVAEGQRQDSGRGLGFRHAAKYWILRRGWDTGVVTARRTEPWRSSFGQHSAAAR